MTDDAPASRAQEPSPRRSLRARVHHVIFESDPGAPRLFDLALIVAILASIGIVFLDSVPSISAEWGGVLDVAEWTFTIAFTVEYVVRLWCIERPLYYARSFFGVVDLLGVLPTYLSLIFADSQYLAVVRVLRVLRVFRILRLVRWVTDAAELMDAIRQSARKITVFVTAVLSLAVIFGSLMYVVEGPEHGFDSIPRAIYWAVSTLTTVGYGDIVPATAPGRFLATCIMVLGFGIIAVPTGIVTAEMTMARRRRANARSCRSCSAEGHANEASYCWRCGEALFERKRAEEEEGAGA